LHSWQGSEAAASGASAPGGASAPSGAFGTLPRVPEAKDLKDPPHELSLEANSSGNQAQTTAESAHGRAAGTGVVAAMWIQHTTIHV